MEAYTTAHIEVVTFEEDVITASAANITGEVQCWENKDIDGQISWSISYPNGTNETVVSPDKPEVCP